MAEKQEVKKAPKDWEPKIVCFACQWCSYAGADLAGTSRMKYPENIQIIRIPCTGRLNPHYVMKALSKGIDGVLVSGCHTGDCHYLHGNYFARRRVIVLKRLLESMGIEKERLQMSWISGSEGRKFTEVVKEVLARIKALGPMEYFDTEEEQD